VQNGGTTSGSVTEPSGSAEGSSGSILAATVMMILVSFVMCC
jgi:hypothetical protein